MKGLWISKNIWLALELTLTERCLLGIISNFDKCYMNNKTFALQLGIIPNSASNMIHKLKRMGLIEIHYEGYRRILRYAYKHIQVEETSNDMLPSEDVNSPSGDIRATSGSVDNPSGNVKAPSVDGTEDKEKKEKKEKKKKKKKTPSSSDKSSFNKGNEEEEEEGKGGGGGDFDNGGFGSAQPPNAQPPMAKLFGEAFPHEHEFIFALTDIITDVLDYSNLYWSLRRWSESKKMKGDIRAYSYDWCTVAISWVKRSPMEFKPPIDEDNLPLY